MPLSFFGGDMKVIAKRNFSKFKAGETYVLPDREALHFIDCDMMTAGSEVFPQAGKGIKSPSLPAAQVSHKQTVTKSKSGDRKKKRDASLP